MWPSEHRLNFLFRYRSMVRPGAGPIVIIGSGPIGLFACLRLRLASKSRILAGEPNTTAWPDERIIILEKRSDEHTRHQVILIREPMATILEVIMQEVIMQAVPPNDEIARYYSLGVRYNHGQPNYMISFQINVLQDLLQMAARSMDNITFINNAAAINVTNGGIGYVDSQGVLSLTPCQLAIDTSAGGFASLSEDVTYDIYYEPPMLHKHNATFGLKLKTTATDLWRDMATTPLFLQRDLMFHKTIMPSSTQKSIVRRHVIRSPDGSSERAPLTRVLPFRRNMDGTEAETEVYIGSEIPKWFKGREHEFMVRLLEAILNKSIDEIGSLTLTSPFTIDSLKGRRSCITRKDGVLIQRIGDAYYQPHYLTGAGIKNAYEPLEILLSKNDTQELTDGEIESMNNDLLVNMQKYHTQLDLLLSGHEIETKRRERQGR